MNTPTRKDWVLYGAMACAMVSTAHAEWSLAVAAHWNVFVAGTLPGALDLYVVRALQVSKDVLPAVLVAVLANVAAHLVQAGDVPVDWPLVSAVGAITPLILWRVHHLMRHGRGRTRKEILWDVPAGTEDLVEGTAYPAGYTPGTPQVQPVPAQVSEPAGFHDDPLTIPEWMRDEYASGAVSAPELCRECGVAYPCPCDIADGAVPYLVEPIGDAELNLAVPLPDGWERQVYPAALQEGDAEYIPQLRAYLDTCAECKDRPSIRGVKEAVGVGQDRARRLLKYAGYPVPVKENGS